MVFVGIVSIVAGLMLMLWLWRREVPRQSSVLCGVILVGIAGCGDSSHHDKKYIPVRFLQVDREYHDLGTVEGSVQKTAEFRLTNTGTVPLNLEVAKTCGCVEATLTPPSPLAPSKEAILSVVINASGKRAGPFSESVFIRPQEVAEELRLDVAGRLEGVWVNGTGFTLHASDRELSTIDLQGFFVSKKPAIEFRELTLDTLDLTADVIRRVEEVHAQPGTGHLFRWSIPLVAKSENWRSKFGQRRGRMKVLISGREQELLFQLNILP